MLQNGQNKEHYEVKGDQGIHKALVSIENDLPFPILGFDSNNGTEFLTGIFTDILQTEKHQYNSHNQERIRKMTTHILKRKTGVSFDSILDITVLNRWI